MEKMDNMKYQIKNFNTEGNYKKESNGSAINKNIETEMKNAFSSFQVDSTQLKKESVILKIEQQKLLKLKHKEEKKCV